MTLRVDRFYILVGHTRDEKVLVIASATERVELTNLVVEALGPLSDIFSMLAIESCGGFLEHAVATDASPTHRGTGKAQ